MAPKTCRCGECGSLDRATLFCSIIGRKVFLVSDRCWIDPTVDYTPVAMVQ